MLAHRQIRAPQGTSRETVVCQIDLICAPQLMSAEGPLRAPNGGSQRAPPMPFVTFCEEIGRGAGSWSMAADDTLGDGG
jgi:hypothetical protein